MARKKGLCFVVMPFGVKPVGRARVNFDVVFKKLIEPAAIGADFDVERADTREAPGSITGDFLNQIFKADVVVADITYPNANVFYELGVRHGLSQFGTVLVRLVGGDLAVERNGLLRPTLTPLAAPFDVKDIPILDVTLAKKTVTDAVDTLKGRILDAANQSTIDSPVHYHVKGLRVERVVSPAAGRQDRTFELVNAPGRFIGFRSGDICNLKGGEAIDYWVNSENTQMLMARTVERSVSSTVRYHGAADPDPLSPTFEDTIAIALKAEMGNRHHIDEGDVLVTTSGRLQSTHGVKALLHAASVRGVHGRGFESISDPRLSECVAKILLKARDLTMNGQTHPPGRSVAIPLLGAGQARREPTQIAGLLVSSAIDALEDFGPLVAPNDIDLVVFCAYSQSDVDLMRRIFASLEKSGRVRATPKSSLPGRAP
ncbi:macro domain-containing protein [Vitreimonas flagellata]|uniref:macro domain-containing protein n=1 Tax=Vitreimonas flagellata TaxID=2560861 RepID=UPI0010758B00|nr:hypothetical protein [Vitreimonas flagellata]